MNATPAGQVRFGLRLPNSGPLAGPQAMLSLPRRAEEKGFDSVWVHDHISWGPERITHFSAGAIEACGGQDPLFFESVTTAAIVGAVVPRIKVGIAGLALPLRDPRILAKQAASIDEMLGGGRLVVAVGVGSQPHDFSVMGVPWHRRGRISNDYLAALRTILGSTGSVSFESPSVSFEGATFQPRGAGVEVWVAADSDAGLARAARLSDGWLTSSLSLEDYAAAAQRWKAVTEAAGRDPGTLTAAYEAFACVKETREEAVSAASASLIHLHGSVAEGLERAIVGDADSCVERVRRLAELGVRSFELRLISRTLAEMEEMVDLISESVLPAFRQTAAS